MSSAADDHEAGKAAVCEAKEEKESPNDDIDSDDDGRSIIRYTVSQDVGEFKDWTGLKHNWTSQDAELQTRQDSNRY